MPVLRNASLVAALLVFVACVAHAATLSEADKLRAQGDQAYWNGDLNVAVRCFTEAIRLKTGFADAYCDRAAVHAKRRDFDKALADYTEAIRLKPDLAKAYWGRGMIYEKRREYLRAIADYNEAIRLKPDFAAAYDSRGNAYDEIGDHDRAIVDYGEAIRVNPYAPETYYNRGIAYARKGDADKAIADCGEAIRLEPDYANAYHERGKAYEKKGDHQRADADYAEAARLNPYHWATRMPAHDDSYILVRFVPWLLAACLVILAAAAFLHWRRTRHWCLLMLAIGALVVEAGGIGGQVTQLLMRLRLDSAPSSEAFRSHMDVLTIWLTIWAVFLTSGAAVALVGGIGAIRWALKLKQRPEQPPTTAAL